MNFLAHLYLSGKEEPLIVGNFLGDFLKNPQVAKLPQSIRQGVWLHRRIDSFTDQHPVVRNSAKLLRSVHGRYAPVILDVLHDYILAKNWTRYSDDSLIKFTSGIYKILQNHRHLMPAFLQHRLPLMIADDWLTRYGTEEGLRFTFSKMKLRSSNPHFFENAVESMQDNFEQLENDFNTFFPEAILMFKDWKLQLDEKPET